MRRITIPVELLTVAGRQAGLVSTAQCDAHGVHSGTRARLVRSGRWHRPTHGVYAIPGTVRPPRTTTEEWAQRHQRQVWATLLSSPSDAIPVGLTALAVLELWGLPRDLGCEVVYGRGRHATGSEHIRVRQFSEFPTTAIGNTRVPTVAAALTQALPEVGRDLAVVLLDNALNRNLLLPEELPSVRAGVAGRRGAARLHEVWPLVDARAESPIETRARLECLAEGLPPDDLQVELHDAFGTFLGRGDLGWLAPDGSWVIGEMDGIEEHNKPAALVRDRNRQNDIVGRSTATVLRFCGEDLGTGRIVRDVRAALSNLRTGGSVRYAAR